MFGFQEVSSKLQTSWNSVDAMNKLKEEIFSNVTDKRLTNDKIFER